MEAAHVERRGEFFYLLYSGGLCCTKRCAYAVGVARARRLLGPWRKFPGNPILRGGQRLEMPRARDRRGRRGRRQDGPLPRLPRRRGADRGAAVAGGAVHLRGRRLAPHRRRPAPGARGGGRRDRLQRQLRRPGARVGVRRPASARHQYGQWPDPARARGEQAAPGRRRAGAPRGHRELHGHRRDRRRFAPGEQVAGWRHQGRHRLLPQRVRGDRSCRGQP